MDLVRRLPLFRRSFEQVDLYRPAWEQANAAARRATGPLWVVLGDSAAQGAVASAHDRGYVQWADALSAAHCRSAGTSDREATAR